MWELERYLTRRRKNIDRRYEFRSSRLTDVFGTLLWEDRIREEELRVLKEDKIKAYPLLRQSLIGATSLTGGF